MSRITGKWRLVSQKGVPRLHPEVDQYMELTKDEISDGVYEAYFTNFQQDFCFGGTDSLFTCSGTWNFVDDGSVFGGCDIIEYFENKEGLTTNMLCDTPLHIDALSTWKIERLTNKELIILTAYCADFGGCHYDWMFYLYREMTFEKVK